MWLDAVGSANDYLMLLGSFAICYLLFAHSPHVRYCEQTNSSLQLSFLYTYHNLFHKKTSSLTLPIPTYYPTVPYSLSCR